MKYSSTFFGGFYIQAHFDITFYSYWIKCIWVIENLYWIYFLSFKNEIFFNFLWRLLYTSLFWDNILLNVHESLKMYFEFIYFNLKMKYSLISVKSIMEWHALNDLFNKIYIDPCICVNDLINLIHRIICSMKKV